MGTGTEQVEGPLACAARVQEALVPPRLTATVPGGLPESWGATLTVTVEAETLTEVLVAAWEMVSVPGAKVNA